MKSEIPRYKTELDRMEEDVRISAKRFNAPKLESLQYFSKSPAKKEGNIIMKRSKKNQMVIL
jgi:hypothetical protein